MPITQYRIHTRLKYIQGAGGFILAVPQLDHANSGVSVQSRLYPFVFTSIQPAEWSGNDIGAPPPPALPSQPPDTPTVAPNPPDSPSKRSSAPPSNQDTLMMSPGPSQNVRVGRKALEDYILVLEKRLADKDEELRVALRWKNEAETKLEDTKDHLRHILESLD
jgi:hypothetical protein